MSNSNQIKWSDIGGVFVGTAYLFGDQTGNARGTNALDMQSLRSAVTQVASGTRSVTVGNRNTANAPDTFAFGHSNTASGIEAIAAGSSNTASGYYSTAFGNGNTASGIYAVAFGYHCIASGDASVALGKNCETSGSASTAAGYVSIASGNSASGFGFQAIARIAKTTNICGPQIGRKDEGEGATHAFESFCTTQVILRTSEVDLKTADTHTITLPAGCHFFPDECGVNVTSLNTLAVQPTISFGRTGSNAALKAAAITTLLTAQFSRERMQTLITADGQTSLTATITIGATATTLLGTFYFKGIFIEDE